MSVGTLLFPHFPCYCLHDSDTFTLTLNVLLFCRTLDVISLTLCCCRGLRGLRGVFVGIFGGENLCESVFLNWYSLCSFILIFCLVLFVSLSLFLSHTLSLSLFYSLSLSLPLPLPSGSIGVAAIHVTGEELLSKLMITEELCIGRDEGGEKDDKKGFFGAPLSEAEIAARNRFSNEIYEQFKSEIKYNLGMEDVEELAKVCAWICVCVVSVCVCVCMCVCLCVLVCGLYFFFHLFFSPKLQ